MLSKKEIRLKYKISQSTLYKIMLSLAGEMDIKKRLFCGSELERIFNAIETRKTQK